MNFECKRNTEVMYRAQHFYYNLVRKYIIIIIFVITYMQFIYYYITETNHVSRVHSVAALLYLQVCYM